MTILLAGLNHRTAPLELRERLVQDPNQATGVLAELVSHPYINECVLISTCNRVEVYIHLADEANTAQISSHIINAICRHSLDADLAVREVAHHIYTAQDDLAIQHLMQVACGLDSLVLGESQILGQVVTAHETALAKNVIGPVLDRLFNTAIHAGKQARNKTAIGDHSTSISHTAALLVANDYQDAVDILIIGAGEVAELAAIALRDRHVSNIRIVNRTLHHAEVLAEKVGGTAHLWSEMWPLMAEADVVVCTTGAPHTILHAPDVARMMAKRDQRPMLMVDLAVPRDIEADVATVPGIMLTDVDALQSVVDDNLAQREASIPLVETIISKESKAFRQWLQSRRIVPVITDLRRKVQTVADAELQTALNRLPELGEQERAVVEQLAHRIVNKVLHQPTVSLRQRAAAEDAEEYSQFVRDLFAIPSEKRASHG